MSNTQHNDGGPAFPRVFSATMRGYSAKVEQEFPAQSGMSLRDWFAGQALTGLLTNYHEHSNTLEECAGLAVLAADAVLKAREEST